MSKKKKNKKKSQQKKQNQNIKSAPAKKQDNVKLEAKTEVFEAVEVELDAVSEQEIKNEFILRESGEELPSPAPMVDIPYDPNFGEEQFALSANALKAEDIKLAEEKNSKNKNKKKKQSALANAMQIGLLCIFAAVFVVCAYLLVENIMGKIQGDQIYSEAEFDRFLLEDESDDSFNHPSAMTLLSSDSSMLTLYDRISAGETPKEESTNPEYAEKLAAMRASLTALKAKNPDVYGWIYVEGTTIDHPIVRGADNDYYLDHAYTGEALPIGSIFLDFTTKDKLTENQNAVIYGHNVVAVAGSKSAMFHDVTKFLDAEFFAANKIYIYTMEGVFIHKAVSVYPTVAEDYYYQNVFPAEEAFLTFANGVVAKSKVPCDETFSTGDTMITLSTCTNGAANGRYALHAKLIEVIK